MDWKEQLAALGTTLPEGDDIAAVPTEENNTEKDRKKPVLEIILERKGRAGKTATIIAGFTCSDEEIASVAATLKQKLGTGGSARGAEILIQGDRRADVRKVLGSLGYTRIKGM